MSDNPVLKVSPLGFPWETADPFLFCAHHDDHYPAGNEHLGPAASLDGRDLGRDFGGKDGWSMYHGREVPGFPQHPHRGFETVTLVRHGLIDHTDSLGASARFGRGDVQWVTAGSGIRHAEMFPLVERKEPNPLELFQIWLNLPAADKMVAPHFAMLWGDRLPRLAQPGVQVTVVAGRLAELPAPPSPPPRSWAARPDSDVAIWLIELEAGARWTLPPAAKGSNRTLFLYRGDGLRAADRAIPARHSVTVRPDAAVALENGASPSELLLLQGRPIGEPVAQQGPFVMNNAAEIRQAYADYQRTQFGGWPWPSDAPVHPRDQPRFARHADGRTEPT
jgi:redox-sensitive bicupin YhaK (pirin superfamily)